MKSIYLNKNLKRISEHYYNDNFLFANYTNFKKLTIKRIIKKYLVESNYYSTKNLGSISSYNDDFTIRRWAGKYEVKINPFGMKIGCQKIPRANIIKLASELGVKAPIKLNDTLGELYFDRSCYRIEQYGVTFSKEEITRILKGYLKIKKSGGVLPKGKKFIIYHEGFQVGYCNKGLKFGCQLIPHEKVNEIIKLYFPKLK